MTAFVSSLAAMLGIVPYFVAALVLFFLGKWLFDLSTPRIADDEELTKRDNPAFGVLFSGYMLGLAFALAGVFSNLGPDILDNLLDLGISGLAAIVLMRVSMALGEKLILPGLRLDAEITKERNLAAAFSFAGLALANGLVIAGVMQGQSDSFLMELLDIAVYWAAGQVFLLLAWLVYHLVARFDVHKDLGERKNAAAGVSVAGFFVAAGIIVEAALSGSSGDIGRELLVALAVGLCGLVLLAAARALCDIVLLPKAKLADEVSTQGNVAAGAVSALSFVAVALLFAALVRSQLG
jgi:Predicted membrane protein